MFIFFH